ncbi:hypothetical protein F511_12370 [Dorcoceras hygrometricum]|uniref:Regulator of Vps4 activity in the MVB pathway protein n=1 Tax=Dorcoceras hygrometricum TaxID=472368 RepID=A0A2Z7DGQ8_9LAMI|nr:hypothetical protein F511_12370 [Dorcoceras hygrometricum]
MGIRRKLDSLMGRGFNTSKFKGAVSLAISRLAVLKNQRQARVKVARSDVVEFLNLGTHERALLRVEQVIKEQNMLDVYVLLEGYCHLLIERVSLIQQEKEYPDELVEAASSLIYAASRCGDFPELQEIRKIFCSHYGKDFVARAVELRNNCGVNPKIIQKLSTKMSTSESKMKVLQDIATDNNIVLPSETTAPQPANLSPHQEDEDSRKGNQQNKMKGGGDDVEEEADFKDSPKFRVKYRDVAHAAQAAFESAAYAAAAARAAVKLSRSESTDPDDPDPPKHQPREITQATFYPSQDENGSLQDEPEFEKIHPIEEMGSSLSGTNADIAADTIKEMETSSEEDDIDSKPVERHVVFDQSDDENDGGMDPGSGNNSTVRYYPLRTGAGFKTEPEFDAKTESSEPLNINRRPISVRTKWKQGM